MMDSKSFLKLEAGNVRTAGKVILATGALCAAYKLYQWQSSKTGKGQCCGGVTSCQPAESKTEPALSVEEIQMVGMLKGLGQDHLFQDWDKASVSEKKKLLNQCIDINKSFAASGGLKGYIDRAQKLLEESRAGANPYDGFAPSVPPGITVSVEGKDGMSQLDSLEAEGLAEVGKAAFVLVAGGLGERLGYNGIKVELPLEICSGTSYLDYYCQAILAFQARARAMAKDDSIVIPLAIMTSGDTNDKTVALLKANNDFGMAKGQITILKQELVPAMSNNKAHFVTEDNDKYMLSCKPHGHGDVHQLLYSSGLSDKWAKSKKWICFFQDTNALVFKAVLAALGCSKREKLAVNTITVPRAPGEAMGAITRLTKADGSREMTINVEYNQLEGLLTASNVKETKDENGYSQFPGNTNNLIFDAELYGPQLEKTKGVIAEFVNPKYADKEKTVFKKPTRLECMMQDYPKELDASVKVGFTSFPRWMAFSAVKNNVTDAAATQKATGVSGSAAEGEDDIYEVSRRFLRSAGVNIPEPATTTSYLNIKVKGGAKISLSPAFAVTQAELRSKFTGNNTITGTLVVEGGGDVTFENVTIKGALVIKTVPGVKLHVHDITVDNKGYNFIPVAKDAPERLQIRGYSLQKDGAKEVVYTMPGVYALTA
eukprot:gb/GEZN01003368.1/.p1 GENE.gb/GEZN01003368.1/~~gb/GEZN01003368.1/.p1  ORF type:complete len:666 (-),score=109.55 gb/GEZN01003368.1/:197-2167(-)